MSNYLAPRYWGTWFAIALLWLFSRLPQTLLRAIGSGLGVLMYKLAKSRRHVSMVNIRQAFPDFNDAEISSLNKTAFKNTGMYILETGYAWFASDNYLRKRCSVEGMEHIDAALKKDKGVILLTGHFTTLEIGGRLMGLQLKSDERNVKFNGVYKRAKDPCFNAIMLHFRHRYGDYLIENTNTRDVIRSLKQKRALWFAPDQDFADQDIVFTPFLGGMASTLTATAKMSKMTGAVVVPYYPKRVKNGYKLVVMPALEDFPDTDIEIASARVNKAIEEMVYDNPEQYLWSHKRFKTQPDRTTNIYSR